MVKRLETLAFAIIATLFMILFLAISVDDIRNGGFHWRECIRLLRPVAILIVTIMVVIHRNRQNAEIDEPPDVEEL